jgi:hypothetical protein
MADLAGNGLHILGFAAKAVLGAEQQLNSDL